MKVVIKAMSVKMCSELTRTCNFLSHAATMAPASELLVLLPSASIAKSSPLPTNVGLVSTAWE
jgi:hypothetical protein